MPLINSLMQLVDRKLQYSKLRAKHPKRMPKNCSCRDGQCWGQARGCVPFVPWLLSPLAFRSPESPALRRWRCLDCPSRYGLAIRSAMENSRESWENAASESGGGGVGGTIFILDFKKRVARKFRIIILHHFGLVTLDYLFGTTREVIMFIIYRFSDVSLTPNTNYVLMRAHQITSKNKHIKPLLETFSLVISESWHSIISENVWKDACR